MSETQASPDILTVDTWPLDRLTAGVREAYSALERQGGIRVLRVTVGRKSGLAVIEYLSAAPPDWTRETLGRLARERGATDGDRTEGLRRPAGDGTD